MLPVIATALISAGPAVISAIGGLFGKKKSGAGTAATAVLNTLKVEAPPLIENPAWRAWYTKYGTAVKEARFGGSSAGIPSEPPRYLNTSLPQSGYNETGQTAVGGVVSNVTSGYKGLTTKYPILAYAAPAATVLGVGWGIFEFVNKRW